MIKVLYFASVKEKLGREKDDFKYHDGMTLQGLISDLARRYPELEAMTQTRRFLFAVNQEITRPDRPLNDGDEVAVLPPLSGGD